jgi:hypothetical protein
MQHLHDDDRDSGGFELAMFVFALLAAAVGFFLISSSPHEPVARVRFIEPVAVGDAAVDTMTTGSTIESDPVLPETPPIPMDRPAVPG